MILKTERHAKEIFEKIISGADVVFQVLDGRNPIGTRNLKLEEFIQKNTPSKKIFLIINKIDLIPHQVLQEWIEYFRKTTPYTVFGLSALYSRGLDTFKKKLSHLFAKKPTKAIIVGYPNCGKSSLIKAFTKDKKNVPVSSRAGHTRGIIEIKITQYLSLLDTPGIIPISDNSEVDQGIKGVINPEKIHDKEAVVQALLDLYITPGKIMEYFNVDEEYIKEKIPEYSQEFIHKFLPPDSNNPMSYSEFEYLIRLIGIKRGQLSPGGAVNENKVLTTIIHAWQKNKIKYYTLPPRNESIK